MKTIGVVVMIELPFPGKAQIAVLYKSCIQNILVLCKATNMNTVITMHGHFIILR